MSELPQSEPTPLGVLILRKKLLSILEHAGQSELALNRWMATKHGVETPETMPHDMRLIYAREFVRRGK